MRTSSRSTLTGICTLIFLQIINHTKISNMGRKPAASTKTKSNTQSQSEPDHPLSSPSSLQEVSQPRKDRGSGDTGTTGRKGTGKAWDQEQRKLYLGFIKQNEDVLSYSTRELKDFKIHIKMSMAVRTRTPTQCRTHHQKMVQKFKRNIPRLIKQLQAELRGEGGDGACEERGRSGGEGAVRRRPFVLRSFEQMERQQSEKPLWNRLLVEQTVPF